MKVAFSIALILLLVVLGLCACKDQGRRISEPERKRINRQFEYDAHSAVENNPDISAADKRRIQRQIREDYEDWRKAE